MFLMGRIYLPDYNGGSIVNLMSSLAQALGGRTKYKPLKILPPKIIKNYKNIILLVIDGLGYEYLNKKKDTTILNKHLVGPITSVFLPTTASAITTFLTGVAPQQHAFTGWTMHLKEIGTVSSILPFSPKFGGPPFTNYGIEMKEIFDQKSFTSKIKSQNFSIQHEKIANSAFTKITSKNSNIFKFKTLNGFFMQIKKAINYSKKKKYIYAYWPELDNLNHNYGVGHKKSEKHFNEINKKIKSFVKSLEKTNSLIIISSDHGFVNTPADKIIKLKNHPKMKECLTLPLCGEGRVAYCYVHPSKTKQFENYVEKKLNKYCYMFKSQELINKKYFGLFEPNPKLFDRVGDYILILKEDYVIKDKVKNKKKDKGKTTIGYHGGVSKDEMIVPLVLIDCKKNILED